MENQINLKPITILLVEDNPGDIRLTQESFKESKMVNEVVLARDGVEAMAALRKEGKYGDSPRPDLILLDLNLPKKDGREVLAEIKGDEDLKRIPVTVLTASQDEADILSTYNNHANCYITKPMEIKKFIEVVKTMDEFWFTIVKLPPDGQSG